MPQPFSAPPYYANMLGLQPISRKPNIFIIQNLHHPVNTNDVIIIKFCEIYSFLLYILYRPTIANSVSLW